MNLEIISTLKSFAALEAEWDLLTSEPLRSFAWHFSWWKHFGEGLELKLIILREEGQLVGVAPFYIDYWLGQRRLRFIGSGRTCTDYAQLICKPEHAADFQKKVAGYFSSEFAFDMLELEGVTADQFGSFCGQLRQQPNGYWEYYQPLEPTWVLDLPEDWDQFRRNSRKSLKRKIKKADSRLSSGDITVRSTDGDLDFEEAFAILVELHQDRFQSKGEPGVFADPRFLGFLREAGARLAGKGRTEIVVAYEQGAPLIAQFYLKNEEGLQLYQAGIRSSKMHLEPGHLLLTYSVRKAIENGYQYFDFLRGNQPYKPYWGANPRLLVKVRLVSSGILPSAVHRTFRVVREFKRLCQSLTLNSGFRVEA